jgi:hypothetical protein
MPMPFDFFIQYRIPWKTDAHERGWKGDRSTIMPTTYDQMDAFTLCFNLSPSLPIPTHRR